MYRDARRSVQQLAFISHQILPKLGQEDIGNISKLFLELLKLNAQNASDIQVKNSTNRILVAGSMIASVFSAIMVSSSVKATMMRRDPTERIKTVAELLKKRHHMHPFIPSDTFLTDVFKGDDSEDIRDLLNWIEHDGYSAVDRLLIPETIRGLLNGTMFTLSNCEMMAIYIAHVYYSLPEKHRGYIICLEQKLFGAPLVWYYRNALPDTFILEFNRRTTWLFESPSRFVFDFKYTAIPKHRYARSTSLSGDAIIDALRVSEVLGCFYVFATGIGGAFIIVLFEMLAAVVAPSCRSAVNRLKANLDH
ncbi:uncharacterized protein LOC111243390 [Varroa destructor]|uniref:Uncharacterized protein n=1 Tax=Varroa destructor TaxID=109461 RepID=A0A7M7IZ50_VARDE|nr:uncharacterized protein LOC111243390 [Varroa destructor]